MPDDVTVYEHDPHMDDLFQEALIRSGFSKNGAMQIIAEASFTEPADRKRMYQYLRAIVMPATHSEPKSKQFRHGSHGRF